MSTEHNEQSEQAEPVDEALLQRILEGALLAAGKPMSIAQLAELFDSDQRPANDEIQAALEDIQSDIRGRGFELKQVASGYRFQVVQEVSTWVSRMWDEKPQKYSRALLETLSLIAYRQPITRGDIEEIRGVAVSSHIIKTLMEREWIRIVGHKDVPGRPAMFATTRRFLDYFNLKNLDELPTLAEIRDLDSMNAELALEGADTPPVDSGDASGEAQDTCADQATQNVGDTTDSIDSVDANESAKHDSSDASADHQDQEVAIDTHAISEHQDNEPVNDVLVVDQSDPSCQSEPPEEQDQSQCDAPV